ncbi:MAG: nucleotidyltransferase [Candidatus Aegiribacteria sp.]|nr:nucleotidyltransferase [Candidatus Aegiribacteria sp.]
MLNQDYKEMLSLLLDNKVEFLLVGAYAMAAHGFPRATADIDIYVKPDFENASKLYKTLDEFGTPLENVSQDDFAEPGIILQIGVAPRRIDIITTIDGMTYNEASEGKEIIEIEDLLIPVISRENLIINKMSTGREKDEIDARNLKGSS